MTLSHAPDSEERWEFTDRFRIAVERDETRRWFRRYRWSVERNRYSLIESDDWKWLGSGYAWFPRRAYKLAHRRAIWNGWPWERTHRIEAILVRRSSCRPIHDRPSHAVEPVKLEVLR